MLQTPFFNAQQPDYLNYGATGCTIGHELIHAYDTNGSFFDADGVPLNWVNIDRNEKHSIYIHI